VLVSLSFFWYINVSYYPLHLATVVFVSMVTVSNGGNDEWNLVFKIVTGGRYLTVSWKTKKILHCRNNSKTNIKSVERGKIDTPNTQNTWRNTQIHDVTHKYMT